MRQRWVGFVLVVVLAATLPAQALPGPTTNSFVDRAPIRIASDADFTSANGVVGGTGTPADPYVIAGWHIVASGDAIHVSGVTKAFVVRDNFLEGGTGVAVINTAAQAEVANNLVHVRATGVFVAGASATVRDNTLLRMGNSANTLGIGVYEGASVVSGNAINLVHRGIVAEKGSHVVVGNDIHFPDTGIRVQVASRVLVEANVVTDAGRAGIYVENTFGTEVRANVLLNGHVGIESWNNKDLHVEGNEVRYSTSTGVVFESTSGNFTANLVLDGSVDGVIIWHSPLNMTDNRIENNLGIGFHFSMSAANVTGNVVLRNGVGLRLAGGDVVHLRSNTFVNNTVGVDIPYQSRQSIPHMAGNFVNGYNIDGTVVAAHKVYFYKAANVQITGGVRDSGFAAGLYGSTTAQGGVVLYEVNTATIDGTLIAHHNVGVGIVNSFNVVVANATLSSNGLGVVAATAAATGQVPPCVVSVKDTNITIPVDPPQTVGIDVRGCFASVVRTNVSLVDFGMRFDAASTVSIEGSTVTDTKVGIELAARGGATLRGSLVAGNRVGVVVAGTGALIADSTIAGNAEAGVKLDFGGAATLLRNNLTANGQGVLDAKACMGPATCGSLQTEGNLVAESRGVGIRMNGTTTLKGDVLVRNGGSGAVLASATLRGVAAYENGLDGVLATGTFEVRDSTFARNERHGARLVGSGHLENSSFVHNGEAGIRMTAAYATALRLNVSFNFDGILFDELAPTPPTVTVPQPTVPNLLGLVPPLGGGNQDPMDVHRSVFVGNERDAIRAGAAIVNATHNWFGSANGPALSVADQVGAYRNGISPTVRFVPYYTDPSMTNTGPVHLL